MKKYLMMGAAALVMGASFTSCSKDKDLYDPTMNAEQFLRTYAEAFRAVFGDPATFQDWGFGSAAQARATRATGEFADYVGAYPDANMWTSKGFLAPDPLTHAQKLRAQYYFQMNKIVNPNQPDNGTLDFFMQQVYDGGTDPMAGKSPEVYKSVANTDIESGEHMDHLTCGPDHTHTFNFNNGTCSTNDHVANRDQTDVNNTSQQHSDEIQLLLNTKTSCFGYANSDASYVRDDRWTLVSAKTIDDFCDGDANFANWLNGKLAAGEEDKKCDDEFHRSFIGFDFDMIPDDNTFVKEGNSRKTVKYYWASPQGGNLIYTENNEFAEFADWNAEIKVAGDKVFYVLDTNTNMYCGDVKGMGGMDNHWEWTESADYDPDGTNDNSLYLTNLPGHQSDHKALNLKFLAKKYAEGWLPVDNKQLKLWVKVGGCNDGYYSDWIVTFMPATSGGITPDPTTKSIRIMAEDVSAGSGSDIDFNDVVFDVEATFAEGVTATNQVKITVLAAGGTLPLYINSKDGVGGFEVHQAMGVNTATDEVKTMINTNAAPYAGGEFTYRDNVAPYVTTITLADDKTVSKDNFLADVNNNLRIEVLKDNIYVLLVAKRGEPACKIALPVGTPWAKEKVIMSDAFTSFQNWVQNASPADWYTSAVTSNIYSGN